MSKKVELLSVHDHKNKDGTYADIIFLYYKTLKNVD